MAKNEDLRCVSINAKSVRRNLFCAIPKWNPYLMNPKSAQLRVATYFTISIDNVLGC